MGAYREPAPVRLVVGLLAANANAMARGIARLQEHYGSLDHELAAFPFTFTNYYRDELGETPLRSLVAFETLIPRERIVTIKRQTNEIEQELSVELGTPGLRPVNLDPGYMTLGQFFLATTKDQRQRVYIGEGIFVEPTLYFQNGHFHPFDWTYRDYQSPAYIAWFEQVRQRLAYQHSTGLPYRLRRDAR